MRRAQNGGHHSQKMNKFLLQGSSEYCGLARVLANGDPGLVLAPGSLDDGGGVHGGAEWGWKLLPTGVASKEVG